MRITVDAEDARRWILIGRMRASCPAQFVAVHSSSLALF